MDILHWVRAKIVSWARQSLAKKGYLIQKTPTVLVENPEAQLKMSFDFTVARLMLEIDPSQMTFIQVGAYDGITNDPLHSYVKRFHWRGALLEPEPQAFARLRQTYQDEPQLTLMNLAVTDRDGPVKLYRIRPGAEGLPEWSRQIATLDVDTLRKHQGGMPAYGLQEGIQDIDRWIECIEVEGICFDHLLDHLGDSRVDLLQIDAEGYDAHLIQIFPFGRILPRLIHYEHMHLSEVDQEACLRLLVSKGYRIAIEFADTIAFRLPE